jgi:Spy/CpxP family protein refolding chaperone
MKVTIKATAILLLLLAAGPSALTAQQGKESMKMDTSSMSRMHGMHRGMVHEWGTRPDSMNMKMRGMRQGMGPGTMPWRIGMWPGMMPGYLWGMCQCPMMYGMMRPQPGMRDYWYSRGRMMPGMGGPMSGGRIMDNIPNLTDKQKKEISDLRQKQHADMKKAMEEMRTKIKSIRESGKSDIEKLLTPDQKKWLDENSPEQWNQQDKGK